MRRWLIFFFGCVLTQVSLAGAPSFEDYHFLIISDTHVGDTKKMDLAPSETGNINDLDVATFELLIRKIHDRMRQDHLKPDSIMLLGDLVDHVDGNSVTGSYAGRKKQLEINFKTFFKTFYPVPLVYAFGNNDSLLGNYQSFYSTSDEFHSPWQIAKAMGWKSGVLSSGTVCGSRQGLFPCSITGTENQRNGFYALRLAPKLRLIVLNSVMYDGDYPWIYHGEHYNNETVWFDQQLAFAKTAGDSVLVAMHVPPGVNLTKGEPFWQAAAQSSFLQSLDTYKGTVIGVLAAHTHMDEMRIIPQGKKVIPVIYTAALSTRHGNAPSFKYFTLRFDRGSQGWKMLDYRSYYYSGERFDKLYDFHAHYCSGKKYRFIDDCLGQYVSSQTLPELMIKMNRYYTAGNPNFRGGYPVKHAEQLLISAVNPVIPAKAGTHGESS